MNYALIVMNPRLLVSLLFASGIIFSAVLSLMVERQTVTCYIGNQDGQIVDTFKTDAGEYGCQNLIGYCTSDTCLTYAQMKFDEA